MGYYSAGGYYRAGGFSLKKLTRWVGKTATKVAANPMLSGIVGSVIPGAAPLMAAMQVFQRPSSPAAASAALGRSLPGTPGHVAYAARYNRRRHLYRRRQPRVQRRAFTVS